MQSQTKHTIINTIHKSISNTQLTQLIRLIREQKQQKITIINCIPPLHSQVFVIPVFPGAQHIYIGVHSCFRHHRDLDLRPYGFVDLCEKYKDADYRAVGASQRQDDGAEQRDTDINPEQCATGLLSFKLKIARIFYG